MAFLKIEHVKIVGMSAGVPSNRVSNLDCLSGSKDYDAKAFVETTGVAERRISSTLTASDLCYSAAESLISSLHWNKDDIDYLIFVSQTPDYIVPASACILQDRLGLSKNCYAEDVSLGCSGWVYGLSNVASLLSVGRRGKALLLVGDGKRTSPIENDPLFGHAGVATALEYSDDASPMFFNMGTDGSGYDAIIIPDGGCRNQFSESSFECHSVEGHELTRLQTWMKGMDVFSFGISTAPKSIKSLAEHFGFDYSQYDYLLLHQANMKMNEMIAKKLKFEKNRVPSSMSSYGNTSSASIPLTIITELRERMNRPADLLCCGFGVGLSWGAVALHIDCLIIPEVVHVDDGEINEKYVI